MTAANDDFKAKLLDVVNDYTFNAEGADLALARKVRNAVLSSFIVEVQPYLSEDIDWTPYQLGCLDENQLEQDGKMLGDIETTPAQEKPNRKGKLNPNSLAGQIRNKFFQVYNLVQANKIINQNGMTGHRVHWFAVANFAYLELGIKTESMEVPTHRQFADAYNHIPESFRAAALAEVNA